MRAFIAILAWLALCSGLQPQSAEGSPTHGCAVNGDSANHGIVMSGICTPIAPGNANSDLGSAQGPETRTITCGFPSSLDNGFWNAQCGPMMTCPRGPAFATQIQQKGQWVLLNTWCAGDPTNAPARVVTTAALRQQALRLLPTVRIGSAWTTRALVNAETVLWAETSAHRSLGNVTVVGRQVGLRIRFDHADWTFGDSTTDSTPDPGKPYSKSDPCDTAQCPDYYGHTYSDTGPVTITLTVAWHAEFSLDNGATWTAVDPAPLTGPATTHNLAVVQARGVIVQNP